MSSAAFNWSEYLKLADDLSRKPDEASHRTAISRAYYFVYHTASAKAVANGYVDKKSHAALWQHFRKESNRQCRKVAKIGSRMKRDRIRADYDATFPRIGTLVPPRLGEAQSFVNEVAAIPPGPPKR
jgi:uncharacterized protein (UPF0332 family)